MSSRKEEPVKTSAPVEDVPFGKTSIFEQINDEQAPQQEPKNVGSADDDYDIPAFLRRK